ncbi:hypothetical protein GMA12_03750 [Kocuria sediminis]|uniref:Putative zinc-finger domain-containing protein n=1 Tax=Kocuria sediminis TaxID=1038857 RepID=A0A6N8GN77_9MICC|nr:zf-HC2 domain-containing protein [Kocuria sediminis]MUN62264.1 hypothetical protein [Kocuria sediminis]
MTRTTDEELLAAVRAGQPHAFQDLRDRHWPTAVAVARLHTPSRPDAEQLAGTAVDQVVEDLPAGDGPEAFLRARLVGVVGRAGAEPPRSAEAVSRVYLGLPPSWQAVLWHTEVEGLPLDRTAAVLGLSPAATTALHLEARAGLRAAYRRLRLDHPRTSACEQCAGELGAVVDGALPEPRRREVEAHLDECPRCTADLLYLQDTEAGLRGWVLPVLAGVPLWGDAVDELGEIVRTAGRAGAERPAAAPGTDLAGGSLAAVGTARRGRKVLLGAGALAAAAALAGLAVTGTGGPGDGTTRAADSGGAGVGAPSGSSSTSTAEDGDGRALASGPGTSGAGVPSLPVVDPSPGPLTEAAATARSAARGATDTAGGGAADAGTAATGDDGDPTATSRSTGGGGGAAAERAGTDAPAGARAPDSRSTPDGRDASGGRSASGGAVTGGGSGGTPAPPDDPAPAPQDPAGPPAQDRPGDGPAEQPSSPPAEQPGTDPAQPPSAPPTAPPASPPAEQPGTAPAEPPSAPPPSPTTPPGGTPSMPPAADPGPPVPDVPTTAPVTDPAPGDGAPSTPAGPAPSA